MSSVTRLVKFPRRGTAKDEECFFFFLYSLWKNCVLTNTARYYNV